MQILFNHYTIVRVCDNGKTSGANLNAAIWSHKGLNCPLTCDHKWTEDVQNCDIL